MCVKDLLASNASHRNGSGVWILKIPVTYKIRHYIADVDPYTKNLNFINIIFFIFKRLTLL